MNKKYALFQFLIENSRDQGIVLWFTGLSGSGKTTMANAVIDMWKSKKTGKLDSDIVRTNFSKDLGFSKWDRNQNIFRVSNIAKSLADCGMIAVVAAISPYEIMRDYAKFIIGEDRFALVHMDCDLEILKRRDPKGLYAKALAGELKGFTGIDDPYEVPTNADIVLNSGGVTTVGEQVDIVERYLEKRFPHF